MLLKNEICTSSLLGRLEIHKNKSWNARKNQTKIRRPFLSRELSLHYTVSRWPSKQLLSSFCLGNTNTEKMIRKQRIFLKCEKRRRVKLFILMIFNMIFCNPWSIMETVTSTFLLLRYSDAFYFQISTVHLETAHYAF